MNQRAAKLKIHRFALSGHCHRVELFLALIGKEVELVDINMMAGEHKKPEFLALNPFGQVPVLEDGDLVLCDSNAMLVYLARRYADAKWYPDDPVVQAKIQRWLSVAAGQLAFGPAAARRAALIKQNIDVSAATALSAGLFATMNGVLAATDYLAGSEPTIADIAMYTYTAHAPEGGISLEPYPNVLAWMARIEALPGFFPMKKIASAS